MSRDAVSSSLREAIALARAEDVPFMAAAIAYYALVSVLPALLLALVGASVVGGEALVAGVLGGVKEFLTPAGEAAIETAIVGASGRSGATLVGVALLAWSTLRVFRALDKAFSRLYDTVHVSGFVDQVVDAAIVTVSIGAGLWIMVGVGGVLAVRLPAGGDLLGLSVLLIGLFVVFLPLYYVFPDADLDLREAIPGTAIAAIGWVGLQAGFQVYAARALQFRLYGVIGGVLLLVTWFYLAAVLILSGATANVVLAGRNRQGQGPGPSE